MRAKFKNSILKYLHLRDEAAAAVSYDILPGERRITLDNIRTTPSDRQQYIRRISRLLAPGGEAS